LELTNLYLKTEYSFLNSTCKIKEVVQYAKELNYHNLCITDLNNMYGVIKFYLECKKNNIKPIIGLEINYLTNNVESNMVLYAENNNGYKNLLKIVSYVKLNKTIDLNILNRFSNDLICVLPSRNSIVYNLLLDQSNIHLGIKHYNELSMIFKEVYLGINKTSNYEIDNFYNILNITKRNNIKTVGLIFTTMLKKEDTLAYQVVNKLQNKEVTDINNYFYSKEDLVNNYPNELLVNIDKIINSCNVNLDFDSKDYPKYQQDENFNTKQYLYELCHKGLEKRLGNSKNKNRNVYLKRLNYELDVINKMGYNDYFLIVYDFIKFAKKNNIMVGPGRGSGVSSLVAYVLGIIDIDPLEYNLIFERFLNVERITMPDIDIDFEDTRRDEVINYVVNKYGKDKVAHIITFSSYGTKQAINDTANILNLTDVRLNQILKNIEADLQNKKSLKEIIKTNETIQNLMSGYSDIKDVITAASILEGLLKNKSTHASGIVITNDALVNHVPIEIGTESIYQTQYSGTDLEKIGLLKVDFLGLHNLTTLSNCVKMIKQDQKDFSLPTVFNDQKTFKLLSSGNTLGIFQMEQNSMRNILGKIRVSNFNELVQSLALNRPGTIDMVPVYSDYKFNKNKIKYLHPDLKPILEETLGIILYQEQILLIAAKFAGYSFGKADILRRAISKKDKDLMESMKKDFIDSCIKNGYNGNVAGSIFSYIEEFANYGFNKSHSVAYSYVAYFGAYLKANYPAYFITTMMNDFVGTDDKISSYFKEAQNRNINIYSPHINYSDELYSVKENNILTGLSQIKGLASLKIKEIIKNRPYNDFEDFIFKTKDFLENSDYEKLIYSSSLDCFNLTKKALIEGYPLLLAREKYAHIKTLSQITYTKDEFSYEYLLEKELSVLGFNVKYNFFYQQQHLYQKYKLLKIKDLDKANSKYISTMGIITSIREIKTKNNETMAFGILVDDISEIEIVIFPRAYANINIELNKIIIINGERQLSKDNQTQIIVNRIDKI